MPAPEALNTLYSGIGKHRLAVRITDNSIILRGKALTSFLDGLEAFSLISYETE